MQTNKIQKLSRIIKNEEASKIFLLHAFFVFCLGTVIPASAATNSFSGTLNFRLLDGSSNGKYYTISANKKLTMSGSVSCKKCASNITTPNTTYIQCFEGQASGRGETSLLQ